MDIDSFTGSKKSFIGKDTIKKPTALFINSLDNSNGLGEESCIAIKVNVELKAYESKDISLIFGKIL